MLKSQITKKEKSEIIIDIKIDKNEKPVNTAYFIYDYILVPFSEDSEGIVQYYSMDSKQLEYLRINLDLY